MDDNPGAMLSWARQIYADPQAAAAAAQAATRAYAEGSTPQLATLRAHEAAIAAHGEYRCRPNRTGLAIGICVVLLCMLVPATLSGLSTNPAPAGYAFLAVVGGLPLLGVVGLVMVRKNSYFFVNSDMVGRRNWRGGIAFSVLRRDVVSMHSKSGSRFLLVLDAGPAESNVTVDVRNGPPLTTALVWWTDSRIRDFIRVANGRVA